MSGAARRLTGLLRSLFLLLLYLGAGNLLAALGGLPVPGSVLGMVLLAASLRLGVVRVAHVTEGASLLLRHMALFFVPPGVGVVLYFDLLRREWLAVAAGSVAGTVAVLLVVGLVQQRLEPRG